MVLAILYRLRDKRVIGQKSRNFYTPPIFSAAAGGDSVRILRRCLILIKLEYLSTVCYKKNFNNMLSRFHRIPERHEQLDGRTDRQNCYINIACQCADAR